MPVIFAIDQLSCFLFVVTPRGGSRILVTAVRMAIIISIQTADTQTNVHCNNGINFRIVLNRPTAYSC